MLSNNRTHDFLNGNKLYWFICPYSTMGPPVSSLASPSPSPPQNPRDYIKEMQVENAGIEPATS